MAMAKTYSDGTVTESERFAQIRYEVEQLDSELAAFLERMDPTQREYPAEALLIEIAQKLSGMYARSS